MTQSVNPSNLLLVRVSAEVAEISDKLNAALESDVQQNEELERQRKEINRINAVIFGTKNERANQPRSLTGRAEAIPSELETIHGCPPLMKLTDGSVWKLNTFLGFNLHIWGWKNGDQIIVSKNRSWFSTFGSYLFHNLSKSSTSSGSLIFESEDKYRKL